MAETKGVYDLAIIGSGPAGMSAGIYGARAGLNVVLLEKVSAGGQLAQTERIENYPGFPEGVDGFDLALSMKRQVDQFGVTSVNEEVISVDFTGNPNVLTTAFGTYQARAVVIATGARPRKLGLAHEDELVGSGISYCATCDGNFFRGKTTMVVGGGNTAAADAIYLSRICEKVYLVHRRDQLRATAIYHDRLDDLGNIEFLWSAIPRELLIDQGRLTGVRVEMLKAEELRDVAVDGLFVAVGTEPNTEFLEEKLPHDDAGYLITDDNCATPVPGVYAAGDVRSKGLRQVVTSVSDGALCAEHAAEYLASVE